MSQLLASMPFASSSARSPQMFVLVYSRAPEYHSLPATWWRT